MANSTLLVSRLRNRMGDYITRVIEETDIGTTVIINGVVKVAESTDVGNVTRDLSKEVWTDYELLEEINSAKAKLIRTNKSIEELTDAEVEIVVLKATISLHMTLATDSVRHIKYKLRDVEFEKRTPEQFLAIAKALREELKDLLDTHSNVDSGSDVFVGALKVLDEEDGILIPTNYEPTPRVLDFTLSKVDEGIKIYIPYVFISNYSGHFISKIVGNGSNIIYDSSILKEDTIIDSDVELGTTYSYKVVLETINGEYYSSTKSIVYE